MLIIPMVPIDTNFSSKYIIYFWNKLLLLFFTNKVSVALSTINKNLILSKKLCILFIRFYLTFRRKNTKYKLYVIVLSSIEKIRSIIKYTSFHKTTRKNFFQVFTFSYKSKTNFPSLLITLNRPSFSLFLEELIEKKKFNFKLLVENLTQDSYSLYRMHNLLKMSNYFVFFEKNHFVNHLEYKSKFGSYFYFISNFVLKEKKMVFLKFCELKNNINILKLYHTFHLNNNKKIIILVSLKSDFKKIISFLNILDINNCSLSYDFPKDVIFRKIKMFNSSSNSLLVIKNNFSFVKKIFTKIDLREVFFISHSNKDLLKYIYFCASDNLLKKNSKFNKNKLYTAKLK
nr:hypothetical protein CcurKRNrm2_p061 [Cryptomonas curvata]